MGYSKASDAVNAFADRTKQKMTLQNAKDAANYVIDDVSTGARNMATLTGVMLAADAVRHARRDRHVPNFGEDFHPNAFDHGGGFKDVLKKVAKGALATAGTISAAYAAHHIATRGGAAPPADPTPGSSLSWPQMSPEAMDLLQMVEQTPRISYRRDQGGGGFDWKKTGKKIAKGAAAAIGTVAVGLAAAKAGRHAAGVAGVAGADPTGYYADRAMRYRGDGFARKAPWLPAV